MADMEELNALSERVIGFAIQVHRELGPGLLESTYRTCLCYELNQAGVESFEEVQVPIKYKKYLNRLSISSRYYCKKSVDCRSKTC